MECFTQRKEVGSHKFASSCEIIDVLKQLEKKKAKTNNNNKKKKVRNLSEPVTIFGDWHRKDSLSLHWFMLFFHSGSTTGS